MRRPTIKTAIPHPEATLHSLQNSVIALKEAVEVMLSDGRGLPRDTTVTWSDLVRLGIVKADQVPETKHGPK